VGCCIALRKDEIPDKYAKSRFYENNGRWINVGDSAIVAPGGDFIAGPVRMREEILYAEVDPEQLAGSRYIFDVAGHYSRPDVFELTVRQDQRPVLRSDGPVDAPKKAVRRGAERRPRR
jgi:nitrilase